MRFTGGQVEQNKSKTALSIHVVSRSKMMRAMRPNLLKEERGRFAAKGLGGWWTGGETPFSLSVMDNFF